MIDRSKQCRFLAFFGDRTLGFFDGGVAKSPNWRTQTLDRLSESGTISSERVPKLRPRHQRSSGLGPEWRCFQPRKEPSEVSALEAVSGVFARVRSSSLVGSLSNNFGRLFVTPYTQEDRMAQAIIASPFGEFHLAIDNWFNPNAPLHFGGG
jgi:hypothetical protein